MLFRAWKYKHAYQVLFSAPKASEPCYIKNSYFMNDKWTDLPGKWSEIFFVPFAFVVLPHSLYLLIFNVSAFWNIQYLGILLKIDARHSALIVMWIIVNNDGPNRYFCHQSSKDMSEILRAIHMRREVNKASHDTRQKILIIST